MIRNAVLRTVVLLTGSIVLAACSAASGPDLAISEASVRLPAGVNTAMYFTVTNDGGTADRLLDARCDVARCEVHESYMEDGLMQMRRVESVTVEPGATVVFEPGGLHVMLFDVAPLAIGDEVAVDLVWEASGTITVTAPVEEYGG